MEGWIKKLPKAELHCHLDGSLPLRLLEKLAREQKIFLGEEKQLRQMVTAPADCQSLEQYLQCFDLPVACLQKREALESSAECLLAEAAADGVVYLEVRFAPSLHCREGLSMDQVVSSVLCGLDRGREKYGVEYGLILCIMRHEEEKKGFEVLETAQRFLGKGVVALDLAGAEAAFPVDGFSAVFRRVAEKGIPFTIHAGEAAGPESIKKALELGACRIGHGLAAIEEPALMQELAERKIVLELCPSSNLQTKAAKSWDMYPLRRFLQEGMAVTVNTDNRTVTGTTMTRELSLVQERLGLSHQEIRELCRQAIRGSFAPEETRKRLLRQME